MSKGLIAFIVIVFIAVTAAMLIYMKQSADEMQKISDERMEEFKKIDKDLLKTASELDSLNKMYYDSLHNADK